ncbi:hypothetical protein ACHAP5_011938 [Fusarium lateritium]
MSPSKNETQVSITVSDHLPTLQSAVGIQVAEFKQLCKIAYVNAFDRWSVAAVSALHRFNLWCTILAITPKQYPQWCRGDFAVKEVLSSPIATLSVLKRWALLQKSASLVNLLLRETITAQPLPEDIKIATKALYDCAKIE